MRWSKASVEMVSTLLLRLCGPMQSWGVAGRLNVRDTGLEPSKSGVLGLVCAAMGVPRWDDAALSSLSSLRMGIRVDREGVMMRDYQTAQRVFKANGGIKDAEISSRYFLSDACFLVGLSGDDMAQLERIQSALAAPAWPLYLGRKSFVPGSPVRLADGLRPGDDLLDALRNYPRLTRRGNDNRVRFVIEYPDGPVVRSDQPLSFEPHKFGPRRMSVLYFDDGKDGNDVSVEIAS